MTLPEFRDILLTADPLASHYFSTQTPNYTVWTEFGDSAIMADGQRQEADKAWRIQVDRYTKIEFDPIEDAIREALNTAGIPYEYQCDPDPETKYIHHIFDCDVR